MKMTLNLTCCCDGMSYSSTYSEINIFSVDFYHPQTEYAKVFFFTPVNHSVHREGGSASGGSASGGVCIGGEYASGRSASGGPTGMHSCLFKF